MELKQQTKIKNKWNKLKQTIKNTSKAKKNLTFTGRGKYGLRPDQLKFGDDKQVLLTTDSNIESYLLITEFRRNN